MNTSAFPPDKVVRSRAQILLAALAAVFLLASISHAQTTQTWNTNTAGSNWSVAGSWNPASTGGEPGGNDIVFNDTFGETANATTVGNIVDQNYTLNSLTYANSGTTSPAWQVTEISNGVTLTLNATGTAPTNIFTVTPPTGLSQSVAIRGAGTLAIDESGSNMVVKGLYNFQNTTLDMSGLATFNATVNQFQIGFDRGGSLTKLAGSNTLTGTSLIIGSTSSSAGSGQFNALQLGQTNIINTDSIIVGDNRATGRLLLQSGLSANPTVTIRGTAGGETRANLTIARMIGEPRTTSIVDFRDATTAGIVDARIGTLIIGDKSNNIGSTGAEFYMDGGTVDSNDVTIGKTSGAGLVTISLPAILGIEGGTFKVNNSLTVANNSAGFSSVTGTINLSGGLLDVTNDIVAGTKSGTATTVSAVVNISGGTAKVGGNLSEGTNPGVTSLVALSNGTLDMTHGNIAVDTFTFTGGTLKDVAAFAGALDIQNASTLAFSIDGSFSTLNLTGALTLGASSNLQLTLANGFTPGTSFTLVANDDLDLITGSFATVNGVAGNNFSLTNDMGTFNYTLSYVGNDILIVPEPATWALLAAGLTTVVIFRRRRRA